MEPFGGDIDLKENLDIPNNKQQNSLAKIKCALFAIVIFLVLLLVVIIFLSFYQFENDTSKSTPKKEDKNEDFIGGGEINSIYEINNLKTSLLSPEFENINNTIMEIYINEKKLISLKNMSFLLLEIIILNLY
jgi:flagellar biosynthesis/type III secretory pathway M-ring protein FliF/YscJ